MIAASVPSRTREDVDLVDGARNLDRCRIHHVDSGDAEPDVLPLFDSHLDDDPVPRGRDHGLFELLVERGEGGLGRRDVPLPQGYDQRVCTGLDLRQPPLQVRNVRVRQRDTLEACFHLHRGRLRQQALEARLGSLQVDPRLDDLNPRGFHLPGLRAGLQLLQRFPCRVQRRFRVLHPLSPLLDVQVSRECQLCQGGFGALQGKGRGADAAA